MMIKTPNTPYGAFADSTGNRWFRFINVTSYDPQSTLTKLALDKGFYGGCAAERQPITLSGAIPPPNESPLRLNANWRSERGIIRCVVTFSTEAAPWHFLRVS